MTPAELEKQKVAQKALRGDGVSMQTHVAMKEAGVGPYGGRPAPAPAALCRTVRGRTTRQSPTSSSGNTPTGRRQKGFPQQLRPRRSIGCRSSGSCAGSNYALSQRFSASIAVNSGTTVELYSPVVA